MSHLPTLPGPLSVYRSSQKEQPDLGIKYLHAQIATGSTVQVAVRVRHCRNQKKKKDLKISATHRLGEWGSRDGSSVKSARGICRGSEFQCQDSGQGGHKHPYVLLQGSQCSLLDAVDIALHVQLENNYRLVCPDSSGKQFLLKVKVKRVLCDIH
jgi:hypothetical protein